MLDYWKKILSFHRNFHEITRTGPNVRKTIIEWLNIIYVRWWKIWISSKAWLVQDSLPYGLADSSKLLSLPENASRFELKVQLYSAQRRRYEESIIRGALFQCFLYGQGRETHASEIHMQSNVTWI